MRTLSSFFIIMLLVVVSLQSVDAQKKKKQPPKDQTQTESATPAPAPPLQVQPVRQSATFRDWLVQFQGQPTNLGTLTKVGPDYILLEDEGLTAAHPIHAIQTVKIAKAEEGEGVKLEIRLLAKD